MEKHSMIALSTAYITQETADKLDKNEIPSIVAYRKDNHGWFMPITDELKTLKNKIPSELYDCIAYADRNQADWIMFDNDVNTNENHELPIYNW